MPPIPLVMFSFLLLTSAANPAYHVDERATDETVLLQVSSAVAHQSQGSAAAPAQRWNDDTMLDGTDGVVSVGIVSSYACEGTALNLLNGEGDGVFWRCYGGFCIDNALRCDGKYDCTDSSDEFGCGNAYMLGPSIESLEEKEAQTREDVNGLRHGNYNRMVLFDTLKAKLKTLNSTLRADFDALNTSLTSNLELQVEVNALKVRDATVHTDFDVLANTTNASRIAKRREVARKSNHSVELQTVVGGLKADNIALQKDIDSIRGDYIRLEMELRVPATR